MGKDELNKVEEKSEPIERSCIWEVASFPPKLKFVRELVKR